MKHIMYRQARTSKHKHEGKSRNRNLGITRRLLRKLKMTLNYTDISEENMSDRDCTSHGIEYTENSHEKPTNFK